MAVSRALLLPSTLGCSRVAGWWLHARVRLTTAAVTMAVAVTTVAQGAGRMGAVETTTAGLAARPTRMLPITVARDAGRMGMGPTGADLVDPATGRLTYVSGLQASASG